MALWEWVREGDEKLMAVLLGWRSGALRVGNLTKPRDVIFNQPEVELMSSFLKCISI
jgi:hypothetical protein